MKSLVDPFSHFLRLNKFGTILVTTYLVLIIIGFLLSFFSLFFPSTTCLKIFTDQQVCGPIGNHILAFISIPGYFFTAILYSFISVLPEVVSIGMVFLFSLGTYFSIGVVLEKLFDKKVTDEEQTVNIIILSFIFLLISLVLLLVRVL